MTEVIINHTKEWIEQFVIKYEICPFAAVPYLNGRIHFEVSMTLKKEDQLYDLAKLFVKMMSADPEKLSNAFIIYPNDQSNFEDFLLMDEMADLLLHEYGYQQDLQVVLFHPLFRYADEESRDPSNLTNRSPYPMMHVLRNVEVEKAINSYHNIQSIPERNRDLLKSLKIDELNKILNLLKEK